METKKANDDDKVVKELLNHFTDTHFLLNIQKQLQNGVKPNVYSADIKKHVKKYLKESGFGIELQNKIIDILIQRKASPNFMLSNIEYDEPLVYLKKAQRNWEKCVVKSINSMCTELSLPLARKRRKDEQEDLCGKFTSMTLGAEYNDETYSKLRPVYSSADFFEVVIALKNTNSNTSRKSSNQTWGIMNIDIDTPDFTQLQSKFHHLSGCQEQCGVNERFTKEWRKVGEKVISKRHVGAAYEYLKQGCTNGLRKHIWLTLFDLNITDTERLYFEELKSFVYEYDLLVDYLIMKDVRLTATNDDSFFVFEDVLYQVLLVFSRDTWLLNHFKHSPAAPPKSYIKGKLGLEEYSVYYPPSGIFPFHGFSMLAASLCYIYGDHVEFYFVFRCLYTRYFYKLHTISSQPEGIVSLCVLFENILQSRDPILCKHLVDIGAQPLRIVFNWLHFAFAGYLATDETLQLWDRILGYNSLHILPVSCAAIMSYRRENILSVTSSTAVEAILADISSIKIIPILVLFLSGRSF